VKHTLFWLLAVAAVVGAKSALAVEPGAWTLSVNLHGRQVQGFPLLANDKQVCLLAQDGRLFEFAPSDVGDFKKVSSNFRPFSAGEMRAELVREFSPQLEVSGTGHYLVAHPPGQGAKWALRFETLYRRMMHYFAVRGLATREPDFPLVAIVWLNREDFLRYAAADGARLPPGVIGYYSSQTNRIVLYDMAEGNGNAQAWQQNAATVIHEATHQTAFNTGIHRRFAPTPSWIVEGLGTLFEARGVSDSQKYPQQQDRINRERLAGFRQYLKAGRPSQGFLQVVADDRLFQSNPLAAYAEAWALTFYLTEKEPRKYGELLEKMAKLAPFSTSTPQQRVAAFQSVFGGNLALLEANYLRFIEGLK